VMKWIDQAGYAAAVGWSGRYCVTVAVGGIEFVKPIMIGELVSVRCRLIKTGNSSMQFVATVSAQNLQSGAETRNTNCVIVFVALDDAGKPTPVPHWEPQTSEERALAESARGILELSKQMEQQAAALSLSP
jgi:acyl-CoA hydrolase